jgi:hypothetical protein
VAWFETPITDLEVEVEKGTTNVTLDATRESPSSAD